MLNGCHFLLELLLQNRLCNSYIPNIADVVGQPVAPRADRQQKQTPVLESERISLG